jgi:hypothetical protein
MDTEQAKKMLAAILSSIRRREVATLEELELDTELAPRTLQRYLSYLREINRVEHLGSPMTGIGAIARFVAVPVIKHSASDKSSLIKRRILGADEWKRGEHKELAAFWPRPQSAAC